MTALNSNTVWTWNAIGKRKGPGPWAMPRPRRKGFLLNHLIHELLPAKVDGLRWANSDPITGQAAWFDLKVRIEKVGVRAVSEPQFETLRSPVEQGPGELRWQSSKTEPAE